MAPRLLLLALVAAAVAVPPASAAVASIDLGSEWLKVAAVHLAPGRAPIAVAINEMSKRKSPALAALADGNRLAGEEAAGITARHPSKVFSRMRDLLAKPFPYARALADSLFLPYDLVEDARGAAAVRADDAAAGLGPQRCIRPRARVPALRLRGGGHWRRGRMRRRFGSEEMAVQRRRRLGSEEKAVQRRRRDAGVLQRLGIGT